MGERDNLILYIVWSEEKKRWWVDTCRRSEALPLDSYEVCRIEPEDRKMMIESVRNMIKDYFSLDEIRRACGAELQA